MSQHADPVTTDPAHSSDAVGIPGSPAAGDPLARVLADLRTVDELPLEERAAMFERMHDTISDALGRTVDRGAAAGASSPSVTAGGGAR